MPTFWCLHQSILNYATSRAIGEFAKTDAGDANFAPPRPLAHRAHKFAAITKLRSGHWRGQAKMQAILRQRDLLGPQRRPLLGSAAHGFSLFKKKGVERGKRQDGSSDAKSTSKAISHWWQSWYQRG